MKVVAYPADSFGCGNIRIIWPAEILKNAGHDIEIVEQKDRNIRIVLQGDTVKSVDIADDIDVVIFQRTTDKRLLPVIDFLRAKGIAVVIDIDDDLSAIHPSNPAWRELDPNRALHEVRSAVSNGIVKPERAGKALTMLTSKYTHSWNYLTEACKRATLVTVSTPGLIERYGGIKKCHLLYNYIPRRYTEISHTDSALIGWPAALHSHPDDPSAVGAGLARLLDETDVRFRCVGDINPVMRAFSLNKIPEFSDSVSLENWPIELAKLGIGIAPLADTLFNSRKSWLKPLELNACGVPFVASPREEYKRLVDRGAGGLLAKKPKDWHRQLTRLTSDEQFRKALSATGREFAKTMVIEDHAELWLEAWNRAYEIQRKSVKVSV